jgi:phosphoglycerate dehydrogenase-like enzyme
MTRLARGPGPGVHIAPFTDERFENAVRDGGGYVTAPEDAEALVWTDPFNPQALEELLTSANPKWVQLPMAGLERFFESGVIDANRTWTCAKGLHGYGYACAELALTLMLAAARQVHVHSRNRSWERVGMNSPHRMLKGSTVMIVGTGGIGSALASLLEPFGVQIFGVNRSGTPLESADRTVQTPEMNDLVPETDFLVIAAALTPETHGLVNSKTIDLMRPTAWLVNVARGGLVVTDDLVDGLERGAIGGAALDVTDPEPLPEGHPLWNFDNVIITPHVANTVSMSFPTLTNLIRENVRRFAEGQPLESLVDPELGY